MTILKVTPEAEASGLTAEIYDADRRSLGRVPSHTKAMSLNPEAYLAWKSRLRRRIPRSRGREWGRRRLGAVPAVSDGHHRRRPQLDPRQGAREINGLRPQQRIT